MLHRIFIAIELPENIQKTLAKFHRNWPELPAKWVKEQNLHITLQFLGGVSPDKLVSIVQLMERVGKKNSGFAGKVNSIVYGPKKAAPRFVWAVIEASEQIANLQKDVAQTLKTMGFKTEDKAYNPHITLARIRQLEFKRLDPEEYPLIEEDISLSFSVSFISIMESKLKKGGAEYTSYQKIYLQ